MLKWTIETETFDIVKNFDLNKNIDDAFYFVINYIDNNRKILNSFINTLGYNELKKLFSSDFIYIFKDTIDNYKKELNLNVSPILENYFCEFYSEALAIKILEYCQDNSKYDSKMVLNFLNIIVKYIPNILSDFSEKK